MRRRDFIAGTVVLGASAGIAAFGFDAYRDHALERWLREAVSDAPSPRDPEKTGALDDMHRQRLHGLFAYIGERWSLPATGARRETIVADLIAMKTTITPSYFTEYTEAARVLAEIERVTGSSRVACERLFAAPGAEPVAESSRLGRARWFVCAEFVSWFMAVDGFGRYGYRNYRGFMGGSFAQRPPPYREL
jgi:hypothetical protein